jgi:hypothetical protein
VIVVDAELVKAKAEELRAKFETRWGGFRRFISRNPLTGFWIGVAAGAGVGTLTGERAVSIAFSLIGL